jgi:pyrophosphatase PpaX
MIIIVSKDCGVKDKYQWYLFDLDGTLVDTRELIYRCFEHTLMEFKLPPVSRRIVEDSVGMTLRAQYELFLGSISTSRFEELAAIHMQFQYQHYAQLLRVYPGVREVLCTLRQQSRAMAIVTSRRAESTNKYLQECNLADFFQVIITPESTAEHKPHPGPVVEALRRLGAEADKTLFIGDTPFDVGSGRAAGVDTALVPWFHRSHTTTFEKPTISLNTIEDLIR